MATNCETIDARHLEGVPFTMLGPLLSRATIATLAPRLDFRDPMAQKVLEKVQYNDALMPLDRGTMIGNATRAHRFDRKIAAFLREHPGATVVQLGVGLDTRKYRLVDLSARWVALDLPEVMELRERLLPDPQETRISADLRRDDWLDLVFADGQPQAVFIVAEGLFYYLDTATIHRLVQGVAKRFATSGAAVEMMLDYYHPYFMRNGAQKAVQKAKARLTWGLKDPRQLCPHVTTLRMTGRESLGPFLPWHVQLFTWVFWLCAWGHHAYGLATYRWDTEPSAT